VKKNNNKRLGEQKRNTLRCKLAVIQILIIDEISMVGSDLMLPVQEVFQSDFGGLSILVFGDLF